MLSLCVSDIDVTIDQEFSSAMQMANVWSVYFHFNTLSCQNYFSRGYGGYFRDQKIEILGGGDGLSEIPSVVGVWIFSGTTQWSSKQNGKK